MWVTLQKTSHAPVAICNARRSSCPGVNPVTLSQGHQTEFQNTVVALEMLDQGAPFLGLYSKEINRTTKKKIYVQKLEISGLFRNVGVGVFILSHIRMI